MFSSWVSYVKTSVSPKAWLAKHVAQALNDVFVLSTTGSNNNNNNNNSNIESNLLTDTKIVLKNARVRPRQLSPTAWLVGEVEEMEFSWVWGGAAGTNSTTGSSSSSSSFVRDTRLTIRGAKFRIVVGKNPLSPKELAEAIPLAPSVAVTKAQNAESSPPATSASSASGYMQRQIQQIVDSLTLNIADFSLLIEEEGKGISGGGIQVQAKSLQLISFGRQQQGSAAAAAAGGESPAPPLSQRISLQSIGIKLLQSNTNDIDLPLLDPIGYAASVKRVTGKRFLDGWRTGLEVVGEVLNGDGFVIHAGSAQMQTLSRLLKPLMEVDEDNSSNVVSNHDDPLSARIASLSITGDEGDNGDKRVFFDPNEVLPPPVDGQRPAAVTTPTTTITMPLPSVSVILPEGTTVRMPHCTLLYHMDGSRSQLLGNQGVWIGEQPFLKFAADQIDGGDGVTPESARWKMDFVQRLLSLQKPSATTTVAAHVEWNDAIMKQVVAECQQLVSAVPQQLVEQVETAIQEYEDAATSKSVSESLESITTWRFESGSGSVLSMCVTGDREWIQASMVSPSVAISTDGAGKFQLVQLGLDKAQIGPTSFGTSKSSMIQIPRLALTTDINTGQQCIVFQECINATLESQSVMSELQDFGMDIIDFPLLQADVAAPISSLGKTVSEASEKLVDSSQMPSLRAPGVRLRLEEESAQAMIKDVVINFPSDDAVAISCGTLQCWIIDSSAEEMSFLECVSAQGIAAQLRQASKNLTINQVSKLSVPGFVERLVEPLRTIRLRYDSTQAKLQVDAPSHLHLEVTPTLLGTGNTEASMTPAQTSGVLHLPVSIQARLAKVTLSSEQKSICLQPLQISIAPNGMRITASLWGNSSAVRIQVKDKEGKECRWLDASIDSGSGVTLSNGLELMKLECTGARVGGASCGHLDVSIPPFSMSKADCAPRVKVNGSFEVSLQSVAVAKEVQSMMESIVGSSATKNDPLSATEPSGLLSPWQQIEVILPTATVVVKEPSHAVIHVANLRICFNDVRADTIKMSIVDNVASFGKLSLLASDAKVALSTDYQRAAVSLKTASLEGDNGLAMSFSDAKVNLEAPATALVCFGRIDHFVVPQMFELLEPMTDTSFSFADGYLDINAAKICGVCPLMASQKQSGNSNNSSPGAGNMSSTFPIHAKVQELWIKASTESAVAISVTPIDLLVVPLEGVISVDTNCETDVRIVDSGNDRWLQASMALVSMVIDPMGPASLPKQASCSFINIGPSSIGRVGITIPSVEISHSSAIQCGEVTGVIESFDVAQQFQLLFQECFPSDGVGAPIPFTWSIPRMILEVVAFKAKIIVESLSSNSAMDELQCSRFGCQDDRGMAAAFSGLHAKKIGNAYSAEIATIDALYMPGVCSIERPLQQKTTLVFENDGLTIGVPSIDVIVFGGEENTQDRGPSQDGNSIEIPFSVRLNLQQVNIRSFSKDGERTRLSQLAFHLRPQDKDPFAEGVPQAVMFQLVLTSAENKLLKMVTTKVSGVVYPSDLSTIHRLKLSTAAAEVAVGFSSVDWASIFGNQTDQEISKPIALPLCSVEKFVAHLNYKGKVVGVQRTAVNVPTFQGGHTTDSTDLANHLKKAMLDRVPAMITNASFFGENVSEMTAKTAGRTLLAASTATGCAAGSMIGLVACDSVRGSIAAGKKARGVEASEGYRFGDITRGALHSVKQASASGAQTRRGESSGYQFGDFTVGASKSAAGYTSQNKSRLGSAGASGVGMMIGCAVAGPLGLVAGSMLGSKLGSKAFKDDKEPKTMTQSAPLANANPSMGSAPLQVTNEFDLLGLSNSSGTMQTTTNAAAPVHVHHGQGFGGVASTTYPLQVPVKELPQQPQYCHQPTGTADLLGFGSAPPHENGSSLQSPPPMPMQPPHQYQHPHHQPQAAMAAPHQKQQYAYPHHVPQQQQQQQQQHQQQQQQQQQQQDRGYRFGDLTRSVISKGKEKSGRSESASYKFGDFTRGLLK